jgi:hypothetical protein
MNKDSAINALTAMPPMRRQGVSAPDPKLKSKSKYVTKQSGFRKIKTDWSSWHYFDIFGLSL